MARTLPDRIHFISALVGHRSFAGLSWPPPLLTPPHICPCGSALCAVLVYAWIKPHLPQVIGRSTWNRFLSPGCRSAWRLNDDTYYNHICSGCPRRNIPWMAHRTCNSRQKYHTLVKDEVLTELGVTAKPYLARPSIEKEITNAFRRRDTAVSTARAVIALIRQAQKLEGNSS
jgi:hypothetical protein